MAKPPHPEPAVPAAPVAEQAQPPGDIASVSPQPPPSRREPWDRARPSLRIGVVGHTSDYGCELKGAIKEVTKLLFEAIQLQAQEVVDASMNEAATAGGNTSNNGEHLTQDVHFRFLSCMAPGYDMWAADVWEKLGDQGGTRFRTLVLPEPRAAYRKRILKAVIDLDNDIDTEVAADFEEVFDRVVPERDEVSVSAGLVEYDFGTPTDSDPDSISRDWQAARFLVHHCDVLIALWDGMRWRHKDGDKRTSCTFRSMDLARRMGIPILWIPLPQGNGETAIPPPQGIESRRLRDASIDVLRDSSGKPIAFTEFGDTSAHEAVGRLPLKKLLRPLDAHGHAPSHSPPKTILCAPGMWACLMWRMLFGRSDLERPDEHRMPGGLWREQEDPPRTKKACVWIASAWRWFMARAKLAVGEKHLPDSEDNDVEEPQEDCIDRPYRFLDTRSGIYMGLYRGAFLLTYALGPIAVVSGALAYACKLAHWKEIAIAVILVEFVVVISILVLHWGATTRHWHVRATELRVCAELFRHTKWRWLLGRPSARISPVRVGQMKDDELDEAWPQRFHDAYLRALDPAGETGFRRIDSEQLTEAGETISQFWIQGQISYHERTHCRNHFLNRLVESVVAAMFLLVVAAVFGAMCWAVVEYLCSIFADSAESVAEHDKAHGETPGGVRWWIKLVIVVLGVGCPAVAAAAHGLGAQAMFRVVAERSRRMKQPLVRINESIQKALKKAKTDLSPKGLDDLLHDLEFGVEQASDVMLQELDDWQMDYHVQEPPL